MLLLVLISLAPLFTLQTEVFLNYNGFNPIATVPSASAAYNSASSGLTPTTRRLSTAATTTTYAQQQLQWPPTVVHNDWYILQAAANAAVAAATTQADATPGNRLQKPHEAITQDKQPYSTPHNNYDTPHAVQQQLLQQNQLNYYTYNSSNSGNYRSPAQDTRFVAPYVLTVSNQRRPSMPSGEMSRRREHSNNTADYADNAVNNLNNRRYVNNYYNKSASQHNKYGDNEQTATNKVNNAATIIAQPQHPAVLGWQDIESRNVGEDNIDGNGDRNVVDIEESMEVGSVENDINSLEEAQFDEVFVPLGNALDKIRNFCVVFRRIISDDKDFESDDLVTLGSSAEAFASTASVTTAQSAAVDTVISAGDNAQLSLEVQGQRSPPTATATTAAHLSTQPTAAAALVWPTMTAPATPRSTAVKASAWVTTSASSNILNSAKSLTSTALAIGRGKKLKKKLKKLMLPLLLAYKLKFIALVPLLIGGLTLLVGSTGLAGFFFALFLTVMSLKGGGSVNKSIVIKKVW